MGNRQAAFDGASLSSGNSVTRVATIDKDRIGNGATVSGVVERATTNYDVNLVWQTEDGTDLITESQASNVSAGTQTSFDVAARAPRCKIEVADAGSGSGAVDGSAYIG